MNYSIHIVGYSKQDPVGNLEDRVVIRLVDKNPENALLRAKKLVKKDNWLIAEIVEMLPNDK